MKQCPACNRTYPDDAQLFCLEDGAQLVQAGASQNYDPHATLAMSQARDTNPPPEISYQPPPPAPTPSWSPPAHTPATQPAGSKSWLVFAVVGVAVLAVGIVVLLVIIGRNSSDSSNQNRAVSNGTGGPSSVLRDDFSAENWPTGEQGFGNFYQDGQYHMKGRPNLYLYMFPLNKSGNSLLNYSSKDATVKVTARSVDGNSPPQGYGLIVHGKLSARRNLEGYAFVIYTGEEPKFAVFRYRDGVASDIVAWEASPVIRAGPNPNQLEVRASGSQLSYYVNGQFLKSVTDTANMTDGYVGLYTSDVNEVAFDDMEIDRQ
ncbi:MAG TPA: hypothetical protein VJT74_17575 [Pyrinomonadaceae bacterium]|nr:hypothetical protein [Pyrinomonadaceae bacterium]